VLTFNFVWDIPFAKTRTGVAKAVLDGWQLSGITNFQSGFPQTVTLPTDNEGIGGGLERPNLIADPSGPQTLQQWFNTAAFVTPPVATFGNAPNSAIRGPGTNNWDLALSKMIALREWANLRFRAEFFNAFNHPSFNGVDAGLGDVNFGRVTSALPPRLTQFSLDLTF
jgi:hypothetical protein